MEKKMENEIEIPKMTLKFLKNCETPSGGSLFEEGEFYPNYVGSGNAPDLIAVYDGWRGWRVPGDEQWESVSRAEVRDLFNDRLYEEKIHREKCAEEDAEAAREIAAEEAAKAAHLAAGAAEAAKAAWAVVDAAAEVAHAADTEADAARAASWAAADAEEAAKAAWAVVDTEAAAARAADAKEKTLKTRLMRLQGGALRRKK